MCVRSHLMAIGSPFAMVPNILPQSAYTSSTRLEAAELGMNFTQCAVLGMLSATRLGWHPQPEETDTQLILCVNAFHVFEGAHDYPKIK